MIAAKAQRRRARFTSIATQRAAFADKNYPRLRRAIQAELAAHARKIAGVARLGGRAHIPRELRESWKRDLIRVYRQQLYGMIAHSWDLAGADVKGAAGKSRDETIAGKVEIAGVEIGRAPENFLVKADFGGINRWIATTADSVSETSAKRLDAIFTRALNFYDKEKQQGLTPNQVAQQILDEGLAQSEARAKMLAHTGAMWSYNEGAMQRYGAEGVGALEWLTADDDMRCPFCAEMNGKQVVMGEAFFGAGDELSIPEVGSLKIPSGTRGFDIKHPPLHPNCRCALLPVLDL